MKAMSGVTRPWGFQLIVDCKGCNKETLRDMDFISSFLSELIDKIEMEAVGFPVFMSFDNLSEDKNGVTVFQMIKTSSIVIHFCDSGDAYFDIFSCKDFQDEAALSVIENCFMPKVVNSRRVSRG